MKPLFAAKIAMATLSVCSIALLSAAALAEDTHHDDAHHEDAHHDAAHGHEGVVHYAVEEPEDNAAALALLQHKTEEVGALLANAKLNDSQLEALHEVTYSLEAAVDKLRESDDTDIRETALDSADEAVQALHYASENHKESESREWYARLEPAVQMVEAAYAPKSATPSAIEK